jgi:hypothetical protein
MVVLPLKFTLDGKGWNYPEMPLRKNFKGKYHCDNNLMDCKIKQYLNTLAESNESPNTVSVLQTGQNKR